MRCSKCSAEAREVLVDVHLLGYISSLMRNDARMADVLAGCLAACGRGDLGVPPGRRGARGPGYLVPDDVQDVPPGRGSRHRVILTPRPRSKADRRDELLTELIRSVEVPLR